VGLSVKQKRILFISHHGTLSGAPISLLSLLRYFKSSKDWDFRILMRKDGPLRSEYEALASTDVFYRHFLSPSDMRPSDAPYRPLPEKAWVRRFRQWRHERQLVSALREFDPHLIYSNTSVNGDLLDRLGLNKPTLVHVRELWTTIALYNNQQLRAFKRPDYRYFAVSRFVREYLQDEFGIDQSRVDIIPGSLDPEKFDRLANERSVADIRSELNIPETAPIVGAVGSVDHRKGVDVFVNSAIELLRQQSNDSLPAYFVWVGHGGMIDEMKQKVAGAGLSDRILFAGNQKNPYPYLKSFSIGLMTSRDDPFPRSVLEMAFFGAPIVCYRGAGGAAEFVSDSAGVTLDSIAPSAFAGAVKSLLIDQDRLASLSEIARARAREEYTTSAIGAKAAALIESYF